jgi:hypothetical protein
MCVVNFEGSSPSNNAKKFGDALDLERISSSASRLSGWWVLGADRSICILRASIV